MHSWIPLNSAHDLELLGTQALKSCRLIALRKNTSINASESSWDCRAGVRATALGAKCFVASECRGTPQSEEVRAWLDSLTQFAGKIPPLPEDAFTRESFYQEDE